MKYIIEMNKGEHREYPHKVSGYDARGTLVWADDFPADATIEAIEMGYKDWCWESGVTARKIEELRNDVDKFANIADLEQECEPLDIDPYEDVLFPTGHNTCDRCGRIRDGRFGLFWLDGFDWEDNNSTDQAILNALDKEQVDYCAICYDCLNELRKKGEVK